MRTLPSFRSLVYEDVPTNSASGGQIDGIGIGPRGEPGRASIMMRKILRRLKAIRPGR